MVSGTGRLFTLFLVVIDGTFHVADAHENRSTARAPVRQESASLAFRPNTSEYPAVEAEDIIVAGCPIAMAIRRRGAQLLIKG
jgi:hypothetical protein